MSDLVTGDDAGWPTLKEIEDARWHGTERAQASIDKLIRQMRKAAHARLISEIALGERDASVAWVLDPSIEDGLPVMTWRPAREGEIGWLMNPEIAATLSDMHEGGA